MEYALDVVTDDRTQREISTHVRTLTTEHNCGAAGVAVDDQPMAEEVGTVHAATVDVGRQSDRVPRAMGHPGRDRTVHQRPLSSFPPRRAPPGPWAAGRAAASPPRVRRGCRR